MDRGSEELLVHQASRRGAWRGYIRDIVRTDIFEREADRLFLWVPVCFGIGIGLYFSLPREPATTTIVAALIATFAVRLLSRNMVAGFALASALWCVALGFATAKLRTELVRAPQLSGKIGPVTVKGWVEQAERRRPSGQRVTIRVLSIEKLAPESMPRRVRININSRTVRVHAGEAISIRAVLRPPPGPVMPGGFNFARRDWFRQIGGVGYAVSKPVKMIDPGTLPFALRVTAAIDHVRQAVSRRIMLALPGKTGTIADALMSGQRRAIDNDIIEALRRSGLAHILAISGLHMSLIAGTLFWALRALLAASPRMALRFPIKKIAAIIALVGGALYLTLSGAAISTQRAFVMIAIMFVAVCLDRPAISQRNVALAALVILIPRPESVMDVGFQMSFAAVTALVAIYENSRSRLPSFGERSLWSSKMRLAWMYFWGIALTTLVASIAVSPFAAYHFHQVSHYGLFANLAAMPLVGLLIMPAALLSLITMPLGLETWPLHIMAYGIGHLLVIAESVSHWSGAVSSIPEMPMSSLVLMALGGLWLCLWKTPVRTFGLLSIAAGILLAPGSVRPDILIDRDGKTIAFRTASGQLAAFSRRRSSFSLEHWLKADGDSRSTKTVTQNTKRHCDTLGCVATVKGKRVAVVRHPQGLAEDCGRSDIVISQLLGSRINPTKDCAGTTLFIGISNLRQDGAHAIYINGPDIRTHTVRQELGRRPWVRVRKRKPRRPPNARSTTKGNKSPLSKSDEASVSSGALDR